MGVLLLPNPLPYPAFPVKFHHSEDAESDSNRGLEGCKTCLESIGKLVGDDIIARPKDACTRHQGENPTDEEHRDGTLSCFRL